MNTLFGIAILPLICLGVMILIAAAVIFALRRGTQAISQQVQEKTVAPENGSPADTRWARGDLKGKPQPKKNEKPMKTCPACGGENAAGSGSCTYCGETL